MVFTYNYSTALNGVWWAFLFPISINLFLIYDGATEYLREGFDYKGGDWK